jgi:sugar phosphate isomerase/epimerase
MKLGCHAVLYKDSLANDTENTIKDLVYSGAQGIEVGARFFGDDTKQLLIKSLSDNKLDLFGLHTSCALTDFIDDFDKNLDILKNAATIAKEIKAYNVIMTGQIGNDNFDKSNLGDDRLVDKSSMKEIAQKLNEAITYIKNNFDIDILYHNHSWEFKNEGLIYNTLLKYAPALGFALDIGWALSQNFSYLDLIKKYPQRFTYLHLRDCLLKSFKKVNNFKDTQQLYLNIGQGDVDFKELLELMDSKENSLLVVEYETGEVNRNRYRNAIDYLKGVMNEIN